MKNAKYRILSVFFVAGLIGFVFYGAQTEEYCFNLLVDDRPELIEGPLSICLPASDLALFDEYWSIVSGGELEELQEFYSSNENAKRNGVREYVSYVQSTFSEFDFVEPVFAIALPERSYILGLSSVSGDVVNLFPVFLKRTEDGKLKDVSDLSPQIISSVVVRFSALNIQPNSISRFHRLIYKRKVFVDNSPVYVVETSPNVKVHKSSGPIAELASKVWAVSDDELEMVDLVKTDLSENHYQRLMASLSSRKLALVEYGSEVELSDTYFLDDLAFVFAKVGYSYLPLHFIRGSDESWRVYDPIKSTDVNRLLVQPAFVEQVEEVK